MSHANVVIKSKIAMQAYDADGAANGKMFSKRFMPPQQIDEGHGTYEPQERNADVTGGGQCSDDAHMSYAPSKPKRTKSHGAHANLGVNAHGAPDVGHTSNGAPPSDADVYLVIKALWRQRYAWVRSRTSITLAAQARCRAYVGGDKDEAAKLWKAYLKGEKIDEFLALTLIPFSQAIAFFDENIKPVEKQLAKRVKQLPCYDWLIGHRGIGDIYIAGIYGECNGPITKSHSVSALWKFFGLAVFEGKRQAFQTDATENKRQSYSARRRSLIAQIESGFIMAGNAEYKAIYEARKAYEMERGIAKGHAHNRARRYMSKRFLQKLYAYAQTVESGHGAYENRAQDAALQAAA